MKRMNGYHFFFLWFGGAISISEILSGSLLVPLGLTQGLTAVIIGHLLGTAILVLGGIIGTRERVPAIASTRFVFGSFGSYLFSALNVLQLVGWTAVMILVGANSLNLITTKLWDFDHFTFWGIVIGALICVWIGLGRVGMKWLNTAAACLLCLLTVVLSVVVFQNGSLFADSTKSQMAFGSGLELTIVMPLSWLPLIADYSRFAKTAKGAAVGSGLGYFIGSSWMYAIGLIAALGGDTVNPGAMMAAANLGISAVGIVLLSTVTTTFLDAYSAGVSFLNLTKKWREKTIAIFVGIMGTMLAVLIPITQYQNFLYMIGSVFAPLFAIVLTDYFIVGRGRGMREHFLVNWGAILIWLVGVGFYQYFVSFPFILGATIPTMILTGGIYAGTWHWVKGWKFVKKTTESLPR
ncbi:MAG TPA: putative hydroxymethylpyrimidine transporter CytX [Bacillales bacterium]